MNLESTGQSFSEAHPIMIFFVNLPSLIITIISFFVVAYLLLKKREKGVLISLISYILMIFQIVVSVFCVVRMLHQQTVIYSGEAEVLTTGNGEKIGGESHFVFLKQEKGILMASAPYKEIKNLKSNDKVKVKIVYHLPAYHSQRMEYPFIDKKTDKPNKQINLDDINEMKGNLQISKVKEGK